MLLGRHNKFLRSVWGMYALFCLMTWALNFTVYRYPGNDYGLTELQPFLLLFKLWIIGFGFSLFWGKEAQSVRFINEVLTAIFVFACLFWGATFIQYTPFPIVDRYLVAADHFFHLDVGMLVTGVHQRPFLNAFLNKIYFSLDSEIVLVLILMISARRYALLYEYYTYLMISALLGFAIYYLFPTTAPASVFSSPYFSESQHATGIKFNEIHHYLPPTTADGGLVSFPSFHVIWAWFSMYLVRCWRFLFIVLCFFNLCLVISCVVLGWHYWVDILGSVGVIGLTHWIYYRSKRNIHE